jgi:hypothetical protein
MQQQIRKQRPRLAVPQLNRTTIIFYAKITK